MGAGGRLNVEGWASEIRSRPEPTVMPTP
jgi:hypothetical protein